jgi:hypothetical protein
MVIKKLDGNALIGVGVVLIILSVPEDVSLIGLPLGIFLDLVGFALIVFGIIKGGKPSSSIGLIKK